jgi:hypothetical protein
MRLGVLGTLALLLAVGVQAAEIDDTPATRMAAAHKYLAATDFVTLMDGSIRAGMRGAPDDKKEELFALAKRHIDYERIENICLGAMVKNFTTKELDAMAAFYGSPEGRSAMAKLPAYLGDIMPVLQAEIQRTLAEIKAEVDANSHRSTGT